MTTPKPWERRDTDTDKSWAAFCIYRDMGAGRSLDATRKELGKRAGYMRTLEKWSAEGDWVARSRAYDDHRAEERRARAEALRDAQWARLHEESASIVDRFVRVSTGHEEIDGPSARILDSAMNRLGLTPPTVTKSTTTRKGDSETTVTETTEDKIARGRRILDAVRVGPLVDDDERDD